MDIGLKSYWYISEIKGYDYIFKMAIFGAKNRFLTVSGVNLDPVEGIPQVDFRKILNLV